MVDTRVHRPYQNIWQISKNSGANCHYCREPSVARRRPSHISDAGTGRRWDEASWTRQSNESMRVLKTAGGLPVWCTHSFRDHALSLLLRALFSTITIYNNKAREARSAKLSFFFCFSEEKNPLQYDDDLLNPLYEVLYVRMKRGLKNPSYDGSCVWRRL